MGLGTQSVVLGQDFRDISADQMMTLGQIAQTSDGREFRYGKAGVSALAPGLMNVGPPVVPDHVNLVTAAAAVGATSVTVTLANTAATANQYAGGVLYGNVTSTGLGIGYRIKGNPAAAALATLVVQLDEPIKVAFTATTTINLFKSQYDATIVAPASASGAVPVGVFTGASLTAAYFGWLQVRGPAPLQCAATVYTLGEMVTQSTQTAGNGTLWTTTQPVYGVAAQLGISTQYQLVNLNLG